MAPTDAGTLTLDRRVSPTRDRERAGVVAGGRTLAVAAAGTLLVLATFSAAVTTIGASTTALHAGVSGATWTLSGMSLGLATALLVVGPLADDFGRRRVLAWSSVSLVATGTIGALAPSIEVLVAARILQGIAGAGVLTASLAMIGHTFPSGTARTRATGVWGAAVGGGIALGPLAGAAAASGLGWRGGYWLQAAAAALLVPAALTVPESRAAVARGLDLPGAAALAAAMACLTAGLIEGRHDWNSPETIGLLLAGTALIGCFAVIELRRGRPMLELHRFRQAPFLASISGALFTGVAVIGLMSYSPTVLEGGLHVGIFGSAAVLAAWSATSMVVSLAARRIRPRISAETRLAAGLGVTAIGELALSGLGIGGSWAQLLPGLIVAGVGSGLANAALGRLAVESVPADRAGMGSGANNTARYLGGAAGVALVVAIGSSHGAADGGATALGPALIHGWNEAALVSAGLCALGAASAAACRAAAYLPARSDSRVRS